jgi:hypothetical protein
MTIHFARLQWRCEKEDGEPLDCDLLGEIPHFPVIFHEAPNPRLSRGGESAPNQVA